MTTRQRLSLALFMSFFVIAGCGDKKKRTVVYEERSAPDRYEVDYDDIEYDDDDYEIDDDDYDDDDVTIHVERRHVCTRNCPDHYYNGSRVIILRNHRHGPGCGHVWRDRYWVRARPRRVVRTQHVCTRGCNHFWNGSRLVNIRGHRHGPGCGHNWNGTYWLVGGSRGGTTVIRKGRPAVRRQHVCTRGCNHFWNGSRLIDVHGHRHGPGCGHNWNGTYWIVGGARGGTTVIPKSGRRIR